MKPPEWFKTRAVPLANKIVYASDAYVSLKSTINDMSSMLVDFTRPPAGPADVRLLEFAQLIRPWTYEGLELIRVGGRHDGGYVMANEFDVSGAVSIGVGRDISWDRDIAGQGIPVVMFDPTVRKPPARIEGAHLVRLGLGPPGSRGRYRSLTELIDLADMSDKMNLLLKVDVEGAEWGALTGPTPANFAHFSQIVIEMHELTRLRNEEGSESVLQLARALSSEHLPVHVHANNYDDLVRFNSMWFPNAIEVTYVKPKYPSDVKLASNVSLPVDSPCDPRVQEIDIDSLAYVRMDIKPDASGVSRMVSGLECDLG